MIDLTRYTSEEVDLHRDIVMKAADYLAKKEFERFDRKLSVLLLLTALMLLGTMVIIYGLENNLWRF